MEILADLLEQWEKTGPPGMPPLADIGLPKFDSSKFSIEDHWTDFIDKTVRFFYSLLLKATVRMPSSTYRFSLI